MTEPLPTILLTRPGTQSRALAERLRRRLGNVPILISPILDIVPVAFDLPGTPRFLVLTSAHAAEAASRVGRLAGLPAYCVGDRTAEAARAAGFEAISAGGDAADLAALVAARRPTGPGLHLRGRHVASDVPELLNSAGIDTFSAVAYDQVALPLSDEARAALDRSAPLIVPVYSPRSSRLLADACGSARAPLDVVAISDAAAAPWRPGHAAVFVAAAPDGPSMEDAIAGRARARSAC